MAQVGYFGLVLPDNNFWQGYFIDDGFADGARDALQSIRADNVAASTLTWTKMSGVADADQSIVGGLSATVVDTVLTGRTQLLIGTCAYAIRELIGGDYFWIEGRGDVKGVSSSIAMLNVTSIAAARDAINALPAVVAIRLRRLDQITKRRGR